MTKFTITLKPRSGLTPHPQARKTAKKLAGKMVNATQDNKQRTIDYLSAIDWIKGEREIFLSPRGIIQFVGPTNLSRQERAIAKTILATILAAEELPTALLTLINKPASANEPNITKSNLRIKVINLEEKQPIEKKEPVERKSTITKNTIDEFRTSITTKTAFVASGACLAGAFITMTTFAVSAPAILPALMFGAAIIFAAGGLIARSNARQNFYGLGIIKIHPNHCSPNKETALRNALIENGFGRGIMPPYVETEERVAVILETCLGLEPQTIKPFLSEDLKNIEFYPAKLVIGLTQSIFDHIPRQSVKTSDDPILILKRISF